MPLQDFEVLIKAVEKASGLTSGQRLPDIRQKQLCRDVRYEIEVRESDKARQQGNVVNAGQETAGQVIEQQKRL